MERHEKSRSDREIVYWTLNKDGQVIHEVGLPDGTVIPYEDYILTPPPGPRITARTPVHRTTNFVPFVLSGVGALLLLVISLLALFHVI